MREGGRDPVHVFEEPRILIENFLLERGERLAGAGAGEHAGGWIGG